MTDPIERLREALADRYAIERELGQGGMATVYLARDLRHERQVAVKVLHPDLVHSVGAERFLREIATTAQLSHPHILPLLDSGEADGLLFYAMPYVEGESLRDRLVRERQLPLDDALRIAREVADALGYAHSHGIIHRDIKPENILLQSGHAVVADFGIARALSTARGARLTGTGNAIGTPAYMSPEQASGDTEVDGRADLYALGCVLFEMLGGEPPYTGLTPAVVVAKKLSEPLPRISVIRETVPAGVEAALGKALARTPADRWATAADFEAALSRPEAMTGGDAGARGWSGRRIALAAGAAFTLTVAAVVVRNAFWARAGSLDSRTVAVAPFDGDARDSALAQLGTVAADWIVQVLQSITLLRVVPTAEVAATGWVTGASPRALGTATGAGTVVVGRAVQGGDSVYLRADVVDARTGRLLHSVPPVAAGVDQPLAAVAELARRVGGATATALDLGAVGLELQRPPASYEAYQAFVEGVRRREAGEWERAWMRFEEAFALDTNFLRALYAAATMHGNATDFRAADSLLRFLERRRSRLTRVEQLNVEISRAEYAGNYALAATAQEELQALLPRRSDPFSLGYYAVLANRPGLAVRAFTADTVIRQWAPGSGWLALAYHQMGRHRDELGVARQGRQAFPSNLVPVIAELRALAALGRDQDAFRVLDEAASMAPDPSLSPEYWGGAGPWPAYETALEFRAHGHPESSRRAIQLALQLASTVDTAPAGARAGRAMVLYSAERWGEARAAYARLLDEDPGNVEFLGGLAVAEARLGHRDAAEALSRRLAAHDPPFSMGRNPYWRARIAAVLGQKDVAVALLREAIAHGVSCAVRWGPPAEDCHRDIDFEPVRGYPSFDELLRPKG